MEPTTTPTIPWYDRLEPFSAVERIEANNAATDRVIAIQRRRLFKVDA